MPSKPGMNSPLAIPPGSGWDLVTSKTNAAITIPTKPAITASSLRKPRCWSVRIRNEPAPAITPAQKSGTPKSR